MFWRESRFWRELGGPRRWQRKGEEGRGLPSSLLLLLLPPLKVTRRHTYCSCNPSSSPLPPAPLSTQPCRVKAISLPFFPPILLPTLSPFLTFHFLIALRLGPLCPVKVLQPWPLSQPFKAAAVGSLWRCQSLPSKSQHRNYVFSIHWL